MQRRSASSTVVFLGFNCGRTSGIITIQENPKAFIVSESSHGINREVDESVSAEILTFNAL